MDLLLVLSTEYFHHHIVILLITSAMQDGLISMNLFAHVVDLGYLFARL